MLTEAIREFLARRPAPAPGPDQPFKLEELAAAALMVECARIDGEFADEERDAICRVVREAFSLDEETGECLVSVAEKRGDELWDDWLFTQTIRTHFDEEERLAVIRRMWEVAAADGRIHPFEERLIHHIAKDLGLSEEAIARSRELVASGGEEPRE